MATTTKTANGRRARAPAAKAAPGLRPLGDRVLVRPDEAGGQSKGGIYLPDNAKDKPQLGTVTAVGPGRKREDGGRAPMDVKVGDRVYFSRFAGAEVKHGDDEFLMLREDDVLAVEG